MTTLVAGQNGNDYKRNCGSELRCIALKKSWKSPLQLLAGWSYKNRKKKEEKKKNGNHQKKHYF
jgi:hypothetical protein